MIRFIHCIRKRSDISHQEFREYWQSDTFDDLVSRIAAVSGAVRVSKSLTLQVEANAIIRQDRGSAAPYDGILEYFRSDVASLMDIYAGEETQALL